MNKQELIERIEGLKTIFGNKTEYIKIDAVIGLVSELNEPQKVRIPQGIVPQGIANYIEYTKTNEWDLLEAMDNVAYEEDKELRKWFNNNSENFAIAWIFGYEVEKEKRYRVKMKGVNDSYSVLTHYEDRDRWVMGTITNNYISCKLHTKKQLEEAGFGEVFNSPLFEVEEVEG